MSASLLEHIWFCVTCPCELICLCIVQWTQVRLETEGIWNKLLLFQHKIVLKGGIVEIVER